MFEPEKINVLLQSLHTVYNEAVLLKLKNLKKVQIYNSDVSQINDPYVLWFLYKCYYKGHGVRIDWNRAFVYLEKAASLTSNPVFLYDLGVLYEFGMGTDIDNTRAYKLFKTAMEYNASETSIYTGAIYYKMGYCNHKEIGVVRDISTAIRYYNLAILHGNYKAAYYLGMIYYTGTDIPVDYSQSFEYFQKCVEVSRGVFSEGLYMLGKSYEYGLGCTVDYDRASELYCKGSKLNHFECIRNYAHLYISKKCVYSGEV